MYWSINLLPQDSGNVRMLTGREWRRKIGVKATQPSYLGGHKVAVFNSKREADSGLKRLQNGVQTFPDAHVIPCQTTVTPLWHQHH